MRSFENRMNMRRRFFLLPRTGFPSTAIPAIWESWRAVSYTHLDVYKRQALLCILLFFAGACVFSFLNVIVYRVPKKMSFIRGRSACPACHHELGAADLIPIFSYLLLRGKCRCLLYTSFIAANPTGVCSSNTA